MYSSVKHLLKTCIPNSTWEGFYGKYFQLIQPLAVDYCPRILPWFSTAHSDELAARLHRMACRFRADNQPLLMSASVALGTMLWPFRLASNATDVVRKHGRRVREQHGISRMKQVWQIVRLALRCNIVPASYYHFRLFESANAKRAEAYIQSEEVDALYFNLMKGLASAQSLDDKLHFFRQGRQKGFPVAEVLGVFADGRLGEWFVGSYETLPPVDLILKPTDGMCGRGVERWSYDADDRVWRRGQVAFDNMGFFQYCQTTSVGKTYILQPRLLNHAALAPLAPNGIATMRVVTYRRPSGAAGVIVSCLRMPTGGKSVDNFDAGGIAAPVDGVTGVMGAAVAKDPTRGSFVQHPDSNAQIAGVAVPFVADAIALTLKVHGMFAWIPFVGWDVVITDQGPLLLEANPSWCAELAQIPTGTPLGETLYPEVYLEHLGLQASSPSRNGA